MEINKTDALRCCPLRALLSDKHIEEYVYDKMKQFGHLSTNCECQRFSPGVPFDTREMFMCALRNKVLEV